MSKNLINSILFNVDSYKVSMWKQYPKGTEYVYSYVSARKDSTKHYKYEADGAVFLGLQAFIKEYLSTPVTAEEVALADAYWTAHGEPFNREGWDYIVNQYNGYLPISIKAVPEGTVVPVGNVLCVVENTDPKVPWLTTWVETAILRAIWYPSSVATLSRQIKKLIKHYLEKTGDPALLDFKLHGFGARGCSSNETAALGDMGHLSQFKGTDTYVAVIKVMQVYGDSIDSIGFSIPAAEHSTITSWGRENEPEAYRNMNAQFNRPNSAFAAVSDSFDIFEACRMWGTLLKDEVLAGGGTLVVRPDSGDPCVVLPKMFAILAEHFGYTTNAKGFKVLNTVRVLWGDGINFTSIWQILHVLYADGWSTDNIAFGMGGAMLQAPQRDDLGWAMKCSAIGIRKPDGTLEWRAVYKDPITASAKTSLRGRVTLYRDVYGQFHTGVEDWIPSVLVDYYHNGTILVNYKFSEVRQNSAISN